MDRGDVLDLIEELDGDELNWVDFKQDYEIGGITEKKAEFAKDVSSIINGLHERSEGYLIIGVDDDGDLVGIDESRTEYRGEGPRHIFSFDESDIQQILEGLLDPLPDLTWHTFDKDGRKFGILILSPSGSKPVVIDRDLNDDRDNRFLSEGQIYVRRGSSKEIAKNNYIDRIVDERVTSRRNEILDGINKAIEVGPEAISRFKGLIRSEDEEDAVPISLEEDAEYSFKERISRDPSSNLDSYLNSDIVRWEYRGAGFIEPAPLWEYYSRSDELTLDEDALYFLVQSSLDNQVLGFFWLQKSENPIQILLNTKDDHMRLRRAAKALVLLGDKENLGKLVSSSSLSRIGVIEECLSKVGHVEHNRMKYLRNSNKYKLKHDDWSREYNISNMTISEAKAEIPPLTNKLRDIQEIMNEDYGAAVARRDKFRDALWDLELIVGKELIDE